MSAVGNHLKALRKTTARGSAVTFSITTPGEHDPLTDTYGDPTVTTVEGFAVEIPAEPEEYEAFSLTIESSLMLFFVPTIIGQKPAMGSVVTWAGSPRTVKGVLPIRPDGTIIAAKVIVAL